MIKKEGHERPLEHNGVDFFFYLYYGKDTGDVKTLDDAVGISMREAYRNATQRGAFVVHSADLKEKSKDARKESEDLLSNCVLNELLNAKTGKDYDGSHKKICKDLCDEYADIRDECGVPCFTPGNAQKWVNMTMKYLYEIYGLMSACGRGDEIAGLRKIYDVGQFLHVPIDTYVLEGLRENLGPGDSFIVKGPGNSYRIRYIRTYDKEGNLAGYELSNDRKAFETVWSKIEDYRIYEALRDSASLKKIMKAESRDDAWPIEWESKKWIEIGKRRRSVDTI